MKIAFPEPPSKFLIIKPSALGDIVHTLPFLSILKRTYPNAEIHWVVAQGLHRFLENHPLINKLWVFDKDRWKRISNLGQTLRETASLRRGLKEQNFDVAVDLSGLLRSGLITMASGARVKLGFSDSNEGSPFFYSHKLKGGSKIHAVDRYLKLAGAIGCDLHPINYPFAPYPENPPICRDLPEEYAVIVPSAGKEANRWPVDRFGRLAARLALPSVVIGGTSDVGIAKEVVRIAGKNAVSLAGKTSLKELIPLIKKAKFMITNDTGPMHIAAGLNVPVFAIFGPANPVRTGPYGSIHKIIREEMDCSPCYRWKPCSHWKCMKNITVERVLREIETGNLKF